MKKLLILAVFSALMVSVSSASIYAQSQYDIPSWVKGVANFWVEGNINNSEFGEALSFLIDNDIIKVPKIQELENKIVQLENENKQLRTNIGSVPESTQESEQGGHYQEAGTMNPEDAKALADKMLLEAIPVSVWTDKTDYTHNEMIMVTGQVENVSGYPITITVVSPLNSIVIIDSLLVANDGSFETTLNTAGALWKYDGIYTIKVSYGSAEKSNNVKVELTGGVTFTPDFETPTTDKQCGANDISASGQCIPFIISGGVVTSATIKGNAITIDINASDNGTLIVNPSTTILDGIFMILVDGEKSNSVEIVGNKVTIMFQLGTKEIKIIGN